MQSPSKDVLITNVELKQFDSGNQYKITGNTNAGKMTFKFYDKKKDGSETSAMGQFRSMGLKVGDVVNIAYEEQQKEYQGKPYTDRRVIWFMETNTSPSALSGSQPTESPRTEANRGQSGASNDDYGRRLAIHGFVNGLLASGKNPTEIQMIIPDLIKLEDVLERELKLASEAPGYSAWKQSAPKQELPTVAEGELTPNQEELDSLAESVPF